MRARRMALLVLVACAARVGAQEKPAAPAMVVGTFDDDYGGHHVIDGKVWTMGKKTVFHLVQFDVANNVVFTHNAPENEHDGNTYSRIDYVKLEGMAPWEWGYCMTTWNSKTFEEAMAAKSANRADLMKGCGGHPFSRMKRSPKAP